MKTKRSFSTLLIVCLMLAILPAASVPAWAASMEVSTWAELQAAISSAQAGDTVILRKDVTSSDTLQISKALTLDLGGKTLSYSGDDAIVVADGGALTVTDSGGSGKIISTHQGCSGIEIKAGGTATIEAGTIQCDALYGSGITNRGTLTVNGGTMAGGSMGYGIFSTDTLYVYGGTISSQGSGLTVSQGTAIVGRLGEDNSAIRIEGTNRGIGGSVSQATVTVYGGSITGGGGSASSVDVAYCDLTIYGGKFNGALSTRTGGHIVVKAPESGAAPIFSGSTAAIGAFCVDCNPVANPDGVTSADYPTTVVPVALPTEVSTWDELQAALSAGGDIVLTADVTPDNPYQAYALTIPSDVTATLDLYGHSVDRGYGNQTEPGFDGSVMIINGTLTVTDSASGGAVTGGFPDQYGGGVQIQGGTFNLLGGAITGNSVGKTGFFGTEGLGGGVYLQSGVFNMSGGSISGNTALGSSMGTSLGRGGGVYITGGTFHFTGGEISGNDAGAIGGGVYVASTYSAHDGKINVSGGAAVTDNTVSGAESNVYLEGGGVLTVAGELNGTIGVTMQTPGTFTSGLSGRGTAANFKSDDASFGVALSGAEAALFPNPVVTFVSNGGTGTMADQTVGYGAATALTANAYARAGYTFTGWNTESGGGGTPYADGAEVTLTAGLTLYAQWRKNELAVADIAAQTYTGNALTPALTVTDKYTVGPLIAGTHYTANWENNTNAGNDTARVTVTGMGDYCLADPVVKQFTINRAEWANKTASASVRRGNSGAVNLSAQLAPGGTLGAPTVTAGDVVYSVGMDANVLRVSIRNDAAPGDTATVSVPVTGAANYEDYAVTVTITATDKETQTLSFADAAVAKTYGDADFTLAASHPVGDGAVSYAVTAGDAVEVNSTTGAVHILKAGTATVTATAAETLQYAEASASYTLTVKPKPVTVTADDKAKTVGDPDPALTATVAGLVNGDAAGVLTYGIECVHEETAGTYPIVVSGDTAQGNYSVTFVSGTLTISAAPTAKTQEPTPTAVFTATGPDSGTLTGVTAGMTFAIDSGAATAITGTSVDLTGLAPCSITVIQPGNGTTTIDSEAQTITVTKAATPSLTATQPSTIGGTGSIPTMADHEISEDGTAWTACTGETDGLAAGTYFVRAKAAGTVLASEAQEIEITAFVPTQVPAPYIPTTYTAAVMESEHGTVTVTPKTAAEGAKVTITVTPDEGYEVDTVTVLTKDGREIRVTGNEDGAYFYTQPYGDVTVRVVYRVSAAPFANPFIDVPEGSYFYDAVMWGVQNGITEGTNGNTFRPDMPCTRAQMVTFLWRAAGKPEPATTKNPFADLDENAYYYKAVLWAYENGITLGAGDGKFDPDGIVTRAQSVTFLFRALHGSVASGNRFTDVDPDAYYYEAVLWAAKNGITLGTGDGMFSPDDDCLRAQIMTFLYRAYHDD